MTDIILNFLNSKIDYQTILAFVGIYLLTLWLMFCLWVFMDANKRYKKPGVAVLMALLVFVFNFPALVFYLIVRPEQDEFADYAALDSMMGSNGGVQVPIVNFVGKNGEVQLSLNLQIHSQAQNQADMVIDVGWDSSNPNMQVAANNAGSRPTFAEKSKGSSESQDNFNNRWSSLREKAKGQIKNIHSTVNSTVASSVNASTEDKDMGDMKVEETTTEPAKQSDKKNHKQNKNSES